MFNPELLYQVVNIKSNWTLSEGGLLVSLADKSPYICTDDTLKQIDPRLPSAIRALIAQGGFASGSQIVSMVTLWQCDITVETMTREKVAFASLVDVKFDADFVFFKGNGGFFTEHYSDELESTIRLPIGRWDVQATLSPAWLNEHYPGWHERFTMAQELGFDLTTSVNAMLTPAHTIKLDSNLPDSISL